MADLTVEPYYKLKKRKHSIEEYYRTIPFSGSWEACKRAHQLLFNEVVTVLEERGAEVKVRISNFYFLKENEPSPVDTYWTLKKNLTFFETLKSGKQSTKKFPLAIDYKKNKSIEFVQEKVITLKKPFYDPVTKELYSVGTRFAACNNQELMGRHGQGFFEVWILDPVSLKIKTTQVPKSNCVRNYSKKREDQINNFVKVLKLWSDQKNGSIPYVLGGWSWTVLCSNDDYEIKRETDSKYAIHRKKWDHSSKMGFDCMGMIGRAAQICNIPFYIKNTTTLLKDLKHLQNKEAIELGDVIWYPGHVMVVSSLKNNLVIEARGYERGKGKVQEAPIESLFKEARTLEELRQRYIEKKPITVLSSDGKPWKTFKSFKILKIKSIWRDPETSL